jgi:L-alanine-DL-glutamate epimerase-like enolase superfamily enzyme
MPASSPGGHPAYNRRDLARKLDITVSAGEQTYTLAALADLIAGVRMVQPDIVIMGGITGLLRCAALAHAHGV